MSDGERAVGRVIGVTIEYRSEAFGEAEFNALSLDGVDRAWRSLGNCRLYAEGDKRCVSQVLALGLAEGAGELCRV